MITILTPIQKALIALVAALLLIGGFWLAMHLYGNHRYNEGVSAEDAKWETAAAQLKSDAANAANSADANAAANLANYIQQHSADENAVNAAEANGSSPLDALFGN